MAQQNRPLMVSGIQPTGELMIGNYIGAVKSWVELQATHEAFILLADLHAITVPQTADDLRRRSVEFAALLLACGLDPKKSALFLQSHVPAHAQLLWVLNCVVPMGELRRMTQFKDKAGRGAASVPVGLFDYPVLMAADILLYAAETVPVGEDQEQHLEFTRRIARRFNGVYGEVFRIPEAYISRTGARLMGLQAPTAKMSKSDPNTDNYLALLDPPDVVRRKIKTAVTDSGSEIRVDAAKPGISNLITLYAAVSGQGVESIQDRFAGKGYAEFKKHLAELIIDFLSPIQKRYTAIATDADMLAEVLQTGARKARERSAATIERVYRAVGFLPGEEGQLRRFGGHRSSHGRSPGFPAPTIPRAGHERRNTMETKDDSDVTAAADAAAECMTDCCDCCCCETEEECSMEE